MPALRYLAKPALAKVFSPGVDLGLPVKRQHVNEARCENLPIVGIYPDNREILEIRDACKFLDATFAMRILPIVGIYPDNREKISWRVATSQCAY